MNYRLWLILVFTLFSSALHSQLDWKKSGYTTISGEIRNFEKYYNEHNTVEIQIDDWTNSYRRKLFSDIDSTGRFAITFFIFQTQEVFLMYKNEWRYVFVTPDDTLKVLVDANTFFKNCSSSPANSTNKTYESESSFYGLKYSGATAKICENYDSYNSSSEFKKLSSYTIKKSEMIKRLDFDEYYSWRDSIFDIQISELNQILDQSDYEDFFNQFLRSRYYLAYVGDLFSYYSMFSPHYQSHDSVRINRSISLINTKMRGDHDLLMAFPEFYFSVMNNHINQLISEIASVAYRDSYLTVENNGLLSEKIDDVTPFSELSKQEHAINKFPFVLEASEVIADNLIQQSLVAHNYTMSLEYKNADPGLDQALSRITNEDIKASIINARNHYLWRQANHESFSLEIDGDTILPYLTNKYKDYVLYIDFWATWCGACYGNFDALPALKKKLKGKKVVYVYLCCHCDKEKWAKTIKDYKLKGEHIYLNSEQYAKLADKFNLIGVPKFVIIDRKGRVVNDRAPRPENHPILIDNLTEEISKYLN